MGFNSAFKGLNLRGRTADLTVIPSGMSSQKQPIDVTVHKPLKFYLRKQYETWLTSNNVPGTPSGNIKNCIKKRIKGLGRSQQKHCKSRSKNDSPLTHLMVQRMIILSVSSDLHNPDLQGDLKNLQINLLAPEFYI